MKACAPRRLPVPKRKRYEFYTVPSFTRKSAAHHFTRTVQRLVHGFNPPGKIVKRRSVIPSYSNNHRQHQNAHLL